MRAVVAAAGTLLLFGVYIYAAFGLSGSAPVMRYSSGIFDMDVSRAVVDLTSRAPAYRASVHPLQKLLAAPVGSALNVHLFAGRDRLAAARLMVAAAMALYALSTGALAGQLTRGSLAAGLCAGAVCGLSFASLLAASVPESAALAGLAATSPLLLLGARAERPFPVWEAAAWSALGAFCLGLTLTQILAWAIALGARVTFLWRDGRAGGGRLAAKLALSLALLAALTWGGVRLQSALYPGTGAFYAESPIEGELPNLRTRELAARPLAHGARLVAHFLLYDFVAPFPVRSDFLIRDFGLDYQSLSIEEAGLAAWAPAQLALGAALLAAVLFSLGCASRAGAAFVAPGLFVASQLGLHLLYGREYVLYAPHWHGVLVALLVAGAWNRLGSQRWLVALAAALLAAGMLANGLVVMDRVYTEVSAGLEAGPRASPRAGAG